MSWADQEGASPTMTALRGVCTCPEGEGVFDSRSAETKSAFLDKISCDGYSYRLYARRSTPSRILTVTSTQGRRKCEQDDEWDTPVIAQVWFYDPTDYGLASGSQSGEITDMMDRVSRTRFSVSCRASPSVETRRGTWRNLR